MNAKIVLGELNVLLRLTLRINTYVQEGFILQSANLIVQNVKRLRRGKFWMVSRNAIEIGIRWLTLSFYEPSKFYLV